MNQLYLFILLWYLISYNVKSALKIGSNVFGIVGVLYFVGPTFTFKYGSERPMFNSMTADGGETLYYLLAELHCMYLLFVLPFGSAGYKFRPSTTIQRENTKSIK